MRSTSVHLWPAVACPELLNSYALLSELTVCQIDVLVAAVNRMKKQHVWVTHELGPGLEELPLEVRLCMAPSRQSLVHAANAVTGRSPCHPDTRIDVRVVVDRPERFQRLRTRRAPVDDVALRNVALEMTAASGNEAVPPN